MRVVLAGEMRKIDQVTIESYGIPGSVLMENAGLQVLKVLTEVLGRLVARRITILAGKGNNGGDGFVVARHLFNSGARVETVLVGKEEEVVGDARLNLHILRQMGAPVREFHNDTADELMELLVRSEMIVDALLGTGIKGSPQGPVAAAIDLVNRVAMENQVPVISVDVPSGLDADTGAVPGPCIRASRTVTFGYPKLGQFLYPGAGYVGELTVADISIPAGAPERAGLRGETAITLITPGLVEPLIPRRTPDTHKGACGRVLVVAGSPGLTGAAALAGNAALRAGAGMVTVAVPSVLHDIMEVKLTEVMTRPLPCSAEGTLIPEAAPLILELAAEADAVVLGPGLSTRGGVAQVIRAVVPRCSAPLVLDADALNIVAEDMTCVKERTGPTVLTPHPGEMARLMSSTVRAVQADRVDAVRRVAASSGATVLLKGAYTLVAEPEGKLWINPTGNPGMATAGSGDVLSGLVAALLAQGLNEAAGAWLGAYLHGLAGDLAFAERGEWGLTAGDILDSLATAFIRSRKSGGDNPLSET